MVSGNGGEMGRAKGDKREVGKREKKKDVNGKIERRDVVEFEREV